MSAAICKMTEIYIYIYIYEHEAIQRPKSENNIGAPKAPQKYLSNYASYNILARSEDRGQLPQVKTSSYAPAFKSLCGQCINCLAECTS